jgi:hypothetical protein
LAFPNREGREKAWKAFLADPDWKKAQRDSETSGRLVDKIESVLLAATDYSPAIQPAKQGDRVFELRRYTASKGNLARLHDRFRHHTLKLFAKHGMTNVAYFELPGDQKGADDTLVYFLAHKSVDAARASFAAFRADSEWIAARAASEKAAGGSLTAENGVVSVLLKATDYSPTQ